MSLTNKRYFRCLSFAIITIFIISGIYAVSATPLASTTLTINASDYEYVAISLDEDQKFDLSVTTSDSLLYVRLLDQTNFNEYESDPSFFFGTNLFYTSLSTTSTTEESWTCTSDGTYYLVFENNDFSESGSVDYTTEITDPVVDPGTGSTLTIPASSYVSREVEMTSGETTTITLNPTGTITAKLLDSTNWAKYQADPDDFSITYLDQDFDLNSFTLEYACTSTGTYYLVVENNGFSETTATYSTSSVSTPAGDDPEDGLGDDLGDDTGAGGLFDDMPWLKFVFIGVGALIVVIIVFGVVMAKRSAEAAKFAAQCPCEIYSEDLMYDLRPGMSIGFVMNFANKADKALTLDKAGVSYSYHYEPDAYELDLMRKQAREAVRADDKYSGRGDNGAVMDSYEKAMKEINTGDPRKHLEDWKEIEINGAKLYAKEISHDIVINFNDEVMEKGAEKIIKINTSVPQYPNLSTSKADFCVIAEPSLAFKPIDAKWKLVRSMKSEAFILPIEGSARSMEIPVYQEA